MSKIKWDFNRKVQAVQQALKSRDLIPAGWAHILNIPESTSMSDIVASSVSIVGRVKLVSEEMSLFATTFLLHDVWTGEVTEIPHDANTIQSVDDLIEDVGASKQLQSIDQNLWNLFHAVHAAESLTNVDLATIFQLHKIIGDGVIDGAGNFRHILVKAYGCALEYLEPHLIRGHLECLLEVTSAAFHATNAINAQDRLMCAIAIGTVFFSEFLLIHPFVDGNGRTARLLLNIYMRPFVPVPFTLASHMNGGLDGFDAAHARLAERARYIAALSLHDDKVTPPTLLACYMLLSIQRTCADVIFLDT